MSNSTTDYEKIEEMVVKAKEGDKASMEFLLMKFRPLILKLAGKYGVPSYDFEDVVQYGYLTLIKAINMYKVGSKSFNGYAVRAIRNNIMDLMKRHIKIYNEVPHNEMLNICVDKNLSVENHIIAGEEMENVYKALDSLTKEEFKIINDHFFCNKSFKDMAGEEKVNYRKLIGEKNRILGRMKEGFK